MPVSAGPGVIELVTTGYLTLDDLVLDDGRVLRDTLGGGALFAAVGARTWNATVGIHACSGGDYPPRYLEQIAAAGIDLQGVTTGPPRGLRLWLLEEGAAGKQQLPKLHAADPVELDAQRGALPSAYGAAAGFHVAPSLPLTQQAAIAAIRRQAPEAIITLDIWTESFFAAAPYRDPAFIAEVDAFLPSDKEVAQLWGLEDLVGTMRRLAACGPRVVAVKRGEHGSVVYDREGDAMWEIPALPVAVIDTIGAGDAWCGGFLAGLVSHRDPLEAGLRGTVAASFAVQGYGAQAGMHPDPAEVAARLAALRPQARRVTP